MKNVTIVVSGARASGASTLTNHLSEYLAGLGLTVAQSVTGDSLVVSGNLPPPEPQTAMAMAAEAAPQSALQEAHQVIWGDREKTYGDPGKNLRVIASYWTTHLKATKFMPGSLTEADVCGMMILLKQARLANTPNHRDSLVDIAGYVGLQDRIQSSKEEEAALAEKYEYPVEPKHPVSSPVR
jgi:hypothetical protein